MSDDEIRKEYMEKSKHHDVTITMPLDQLFRVILPLADILEVQEQLRGSKLFEGSELDRESEYAITKFLLAVGEYQHHHNLCPIENGDAGEEACQYWDRVMEFKTKFADLMAEDSMRTIKDNDEKQE